jgi:hypothetical protein
MGRLTCILLAVSIFIGCTNEMVPTPEFAAVEEKRNVCEGEGQCSVHGLEGECIRGSCIIGRGHCVADVDCDDGNACTVERCEAGACTGFNRAGACEEGGEAGSCRFGFCEPMLAEACRHDEDCGSGPNACVARVCVAGSCEERAAGDGGDCRTPSGAAGQCNVTGACTLLAEDPSHACEEPRRHRPRGARCQPLRLTLESSKLVEIEAALEKRISQNLRYDVRPALVALHGGGYNIVLHNRRTRDELRGLCDPSFVAWEISGYTEGTGWKSNHMQIWLSPYEEGWALPTRGGRVALRRGREASAWGMFGVVEVAAYRKWLERAFRPLSTQTFNSEVAPEAPTRLQPLAPPALDGVAPPPPSSELRVAVASPAVEAPAARAPQATPSRAAREAMARAWDAYAVGDLNAARKAMGEARRGGHRDLELELLLEPQ